jgi:hypothetical protein
MVHKKYKRTTRRKLRKSSRKSRRHRKPNKGFCYGRKKIFGGACPCMLGQSGGNYATDITQKEFQGFPYNPKKPVVVAFPGTPGVMDLNDYKEMMEDEDREGYDPTA